MWTLLKVVAAIFLPPVAVAMHSGLTLSFWINLILTFLFFLPGQIHAIFVMLTEEQV